jgi:hypothetical protein
MRLVVHRFLGDDDIVRVAFFETTGGDADETGFGAEFVERVGPDVAHAAAQAADELEDDFGKRALVGHAGLDAFGDELAGAVLAVAVARAFAHGFEAAHAAVFFEGAALPLDHVAGAFGCRRAVSPA